MILGLLGWFLIRSFYFILLEMGPRAATFGKRACGLRVVARSGERLTADRVIVRNLTREIEFFLPLSFLLEGGGEGVGAGWTLAGLAWTGVFAFFPLFNKDRMRVGDLLAGTWVIAAPKKELSVDLFRHQIAPSRRRAASRALHRRPARRLRRLRAADPGTGAARGPLRQDRHRRRGDPRQARHAP